MAAACQKEFLTATSRLYKTCIAVNPIHGSRKDLLPLKNTVFSLYLQEPTCFCCGFSTFFIFLQSAILKNKIQKKAGKYLLDAHSSITYRSDDKIFRISQKNSDNLYKNRFI
jgi:hypothetical protein